MSPSERGAAELTIKRQFGGIEVVEPKRRSMRVSAPTKLPRAVIVNSARVARIQFAESSGSENWRTVLEGHTLAFPRGV
jgi:hypothetical protein